MHVALAQPTDLPAWLDLAAEVEFLFGPMIADPGFHAVLERNIDGLLHPRAGWRSRQAAHGRAALLGNTRAALHDRLARRGPALAAAGSRSDAGGALLPAHSATRRSVGRHLQ
jgi:hypothetical protein